MKHLKVKEAEPEFQEIIVIPGVTPNAQELCAFLMHSKGGKKVDLSKPGEAEDHREQLGDSHY